jgi:hypothetical protein
MPTEAEEIKELKASAKLHYDAIKEASAAGSRSSMMIGYHAYRLKVEGLFGTLGFATEDEAREEAEVGESTWYANIRLAEQFKELSEKKFVAMKQANAKALADMPESARFDPQWVKDASHQKIKVFKARVDEAMNGKAKASDGKERSTSMKVSMPASRQLVIEEKAKEFAESHGIEPGDVGKAIEMALVEATEGETLIGAIGTAVQHMKSIKDLIRSNLSADEVLVQVNAIVDEVIMDFDHALSQKQEEALV